MSFTRMRFYGRGKQATGSPTPIWEDDQTLGSKVGTCDIRCLLEGSRSKWAQHAPKTGISGLLYFSLEFEETGEVPLKRGSLIIDVGCANDEPLPIFKTCAPSTPINGDPVERTVQDRKKTDPHINATSAFGGGEISGREHEKTTDLVESHRWYFKAGNPSGREQTRVTKADFTWARTLLEDHSGSHRPYKGAVVINRAANTAITLEVRAEILPGKWGHRYFRPTHGRPKRSQPIGPKDEFLSSKSFDDLQSKLQSVIGEENKLKPATREFPNRWGYWHC
jgi:hypothetical protein